MCLHFTTLVERSWPFNTSSTVQNPPGEKGVIEGLGRAWKTRLQNLCEAMIEPTRMIYFCRMVTISPETLVSFSHTTSGIIRVTHSTLTQRANFTRFLAFSSPSDFALVLGPSRMLSY